MTAHEIGIMASRSLESLSVAIKEKTIIINIKKGTKFGLGVFQGKILF